MTRYGWRAVYPLIIMLFISFPSGCAPASRSNTPLPKSDDALSKSQIPPSKSDTPAGQATSTTSRTTERQPQLKEPKLNESKLSEPIDITAKGILEKIQDTRDRSFGTFVIVEVLQQSNLAAVAEEEQQDAPGPYLKPGARLDIEVPKSMAGTLKAGGRYTGVFHIVPTAGSSVKAFTMEIKPLER